MDFMSNLDLPVNDNIATAGLLALIAFWRELAGIITKLITRKERAVAATVQEASELQRVMVTLAKMGSDFGQVVKEFNVERDMYRAREKELEEQHDTQIKALEKSLIESQEELKDTRDRVNNLSEMVQKISIDNESKDKTIEQLNRTIDSLQTSFRQLQEQAEKESAKKDKVIADQATEINHLKSRVAGLQLELTQFKAQQQGSNLPDAASLVIAIGATDEPLTDREAIQAAVASINEPKVDTPPDSAAGETAESVPVSTGDGV